MAIVSISKAARITGKARSTIQSYIKQGKLSKTTDPVSNEDGIETSELIRVFGELKNKDTTPVQIDKLIHVNTPINTEDVVTKKDIKIIQLEAEVEKLKAVLNVKDEHIETLNNAMRLLEDQRQKPTVVENTEPKKEEKKGFFQRLFKG